MTKQEMADRKRRLDERLAASDGAGSESQERGERTPWVVAYRISDQIIDILNREKHLPDFKPVEAFCGQLLAIIGFGRTSPASSRPPEFQAVLEAANCCLKSAWDEAEEKLHKSTTAPPSPSNLSPQSSPKTKDPS